MTVFVDYWELWLIVVVPAVIEAIAIWQGQSTWRRPTFVVRTISSLMWKAIATFPHFTPLFFSFWAITLPHFYLRGEPGKWTTPEGWAYLVIGLATIWLIYVRTRAMQENLTFGQKLKEQPLWTRFAAGAGVATIVAQLLKNWAGIELTVEQVSTLFVVIGAIVTAIQRRSVTPMAKIERLEMAGAIQTPNHVDATPSEVIKDPSLVPEPFPRAR